MKLNHCYQGDCRDVMDIARLANLRMWDAYRDAERHRKDAVHWRDQAAVA